jgi:hypothetical protein
MSSIIKDIASNLAGSKTLSACFFCCSASGGILWSCGANRVGEYVKVVGATQNELMTRVEQAEELGRVVRCLPF